MQQQRSSKTLGFLALAYTFAASLFVLFGPLYASSRPLVARHTGAAVIVLLPLVIVVAALLSPRPASIALSGVLVVFSFLAAWTIGLFFLPSAALLLLYSVAHGSD